MKLWIDDVRSAPEGYDEWFRSVNKTIEYIKDSLSFGLGVDDFILFLNIDHDAGDYYYDGGDYIKILSWLEEHELSNIQIQVKIHSMNPVGVQNMRAIIQKNGWREV